MRLKKVRYAALVLSAYSLLALPGHAKAAKKKHPPHPQAAPSFSVDAPISTWHQNPSLLTQLASAFPVADFALRPPQGYAVEQHVSDSEADTAFQYEWDGTARPDGRKPVLRVDITRAKPNAVSVVTLDDRLTELLGHMEQKSPGLIHSPYQHGLINGISFVRTYFKVNPDAGPDKPRYHGFIYKATSNDGKSMITITASDVEPNNEDTLPLLEAAALTFRKP
ncbi:MAG: hypothetical protein JO250_08875 [Armatimonadetes bacterium]|nr:hypothetical protein [Armatimonadota bacterium]